MTSWTNALPQHLSTVQQAWLSDTASMTNRARSLAKQDFQLTLIEQHWRLATAKEAELLAIPVEGELFARAITLGTKATPWLVGYSLFPKSLLEEHLNSLTKLEEKPLGDLLFNQLEAKRGPLSYCRPTQGDVLYDYATPFVDKPTDLLARRSNFSLEQKQITVHEVFLPALWEALKP